MPQVPSAAILLVTADRQESERGRVALAAAGFAVETALEAAAGGAGEPPVLIVLDGRLPEGGAATACRALRGGPWGGVPVAWLGRPEDEPAAFEAGATVFLTVPLDEAQLVALARAFVEERETGDRLESALGRSRAGQADQALRELQEAARAARSGGLVAAWGQYHAGLLRIAAGEPQAAAEEFQALLDDRPDFWRAHARLAELYRQADFGWEADEHWRQARELRPSLPESAPGAGEPGAARPSRAERELPAVPQRTERPLVLLADDSELALAMIGAHLESAGYHVVTAKDGSEALQLARRRRPDLVVLDGLMPGASGFDVCRAVKTEIWPDDPPPVLILSAIYTKQRQRREAREQYGADDLIAKSTDDSALLEVARRLCPAADA
jgi:DNA-binding response OmpR family regulator